MVKKKSSTKKSVKSLTKTNRFKSIAKENLSDDLFKIRLFEEVKTGDLTKQQLIFLGDFIDDALMLESQSDIEKVALYLAGKVNSLSKSIRKSIEYSVKSLIESMNPIEQWTIWDVRIVNLIAYPKWWATANWDLTKKIAQQIKQTPEEDYFQIFYHVVKESGLPEIEIKRHCLQEFSNSYFSAEDILTSSGRWLKQQLENSYQEIMSLADLDWVPISIANLLIKYDSGKLEANFSDFKFKKYENKLRFVELLLQFNRDKYRDYAFAIFAKAKEDKQHFSVARILLKYFGGQYRQQAFEESLKALNIIHNTDYIYDFKREYIRWMIENFEMRGVEVIEANYKEENNIARINYYALLTEAIGDRALPILIAGFTNFDSQAKYGGIDHPKYIGDLLSLLTPYDLKPFSDTIWNSVGSINNSRIRNRFAKAWLKQIADPIAEAEIYLPHKKSNIRCSAVSLLFQVNTEQAKNLIMDAVATEKSKAAKKIMQQYLDQMNAELIEPVIGYDIDVYTQKLAQLCLNAVKANLKDIPTPINYIKFVHDDLCFEIERIFVGREHHYLELELSQIQSNIPSHVDNMWHPGNSLKRFTKHSGDTIFAEFLLRHGVDLDDDTLASWPGTLYWHEILLLGESIKNTLIQDAIEIDNQCYICVGDHDSSRDGLKDYEYYVKQEINELIDSSLMLKDYAAICFHNKLKRKWIIDLQK